MIAPAGAGPAGPGVAPTQEEGLWRLPPGVHMAEVSGDLVFLDVPRDAYHCLPFGADHLRRGDAGLEITSPQLAVELAAAGLLAPGPAAAPALALPPKPVRGVDTGEPGPPLWRDLPDMARACRDAALIYRRRSLAELIALAAEERPDAGSEAEAIEVAQAFARWAPYAPLSAKCLLRSFLLLRILRRRGLDATWVFAVRTWPFAAHCWLQRGDLVLDDAPERLIAYSPILAV